MMLFTNDLCSGATFSDCRQYRYDLWRCWGDPASTATFIMLNPSTADETVNDATVERCERRARQWGFGRLLVVNLFAFRATDPQAMKAAADPIGPDNDDAIRLAVLRSSLTVCAWGNHGAHLGRSQAVRRLLAKVELYVLKIGKTGEPCHPLYLPYELNPARWDHAQPV